MKGFECKACGSNKLFQLQFGVKVSEVVSISLDDGLVCDLRSFEPCESTLVKFRCGSCQASVEVAKKDIVNFLRFGGD